MNKSKSFEEGMKLMMSCMTSCDIQNESELSDQPDSQSLMTVQPTHAFGDEVRCHPDKGELAKNMETDVIPKMTMKEAFERHGQQFMSTNELKPLARMKPSSFGIKSRARINESRLPSGSGYHPELYAVGTSPYAVQFRTNTRNIPKLKLFSGNDAPLSSADSELRSDTLASVNVPPMEPFVHNYLGRYDVGRNTCEGAKSETHPNANASSENQWGHSNVPGYIIRRLYNSINTHAPNYNVNNCFFPLECDTRQNPANNGPMMTSLLADDPLDHQISGNLTHNLSGSFNAGATCYPPRNHSNYHNNPVNTGPLITYSSDDQLGHQNSRTITHNLSVSYNAVPPCYPPSNPVNPLTTYSSDDHLGHQNSRTITHNLFGPYNAVPPCYPPSNPVPLITYSSDDQLGYGDPPATNSNNVGLPDKANNHFYIYDRMNEYVINRISEEYRVDPNSFVKFHGPSTPVLSVPSNAASPTNDPWMNAKYAQRVLKDFFEHYESDIRRSIAEGKWHVDGKVPEHRWPAVNDNVKSKILKIIKHHISRLEALNNGEDMEPSVSAVREASAVNITMTIRRKKGKGKKSKKSKSKPLKISC